MMMMRKKMMMMSEVGIWMVMVMMMMMAASAQQQAGVGGGEFGQLNNIYRCWGGCYNKCFLVNNNNNNNNMGGGGGGGGGVVVVGGGGGVVGSPFDSFKCYFKCLGDCFSVPTTNFISSCRMACSMQFCTSQSNDEARLGQCVGKCGNMCDQSKSLRTTQQLRT